ncbi:MAG: ABC transporter permease [Treponema sp.]|nr:ABC transporter permease [Treponema sp.]
MKSWILFVASRYILKGRANSPVLAVLGIAIGVLALIVIIAVMNGFQLSFIESILELSSYHLRLEAFPQEHVEDLREVFLSIPGVKAVVPFKEFQALARGRRANQQAVLIRGLYNNTLERDESMKTRLEFEEGFFDLSKPENILLGSVLAMRLGVGDGDRVTIFSLTGILSSEDEAGDESLLVTGVFNTGYYDYDCNWAYVNIDKVSMLDSDSNLILGIKIFNRFQDRVILEQAFKKISELGYEDFKLTSWRDYNRSFFGALRTEKLFMFILVGLIFIVVGLNIFQALRRLVYQRRDEIGLLRAVGGSEKAVQLIFIFDGAVIGFAGAVIGLVFGLLVAFNIQEVFSFVEHIVNTIINLINTLANYLGINKAGSFSIFPTTVFYIKEIPSRVLPRDVTIIFLFGFLSALVAAWFASKKITKIQPAEVLRYE